jgi:DHA1 family bicyclomycin/chloramphenicol resistance-like MFS transporter
MVRDRYHGNRAAQVMSMLGAAMAVVPLIAPTIGAWVLVWFNWRATYISLAIFACLVLLGLRQFTESAPAIGEGSIGIGRILGLFSKCLTSRQFLGYQLCGTASYSAILTYLSTVAFFMRDVFALPAQYFGYAFAVSVSGFMLGALICSRLVMRLGTNNTLTIGVLITLAASMSQWLASLTETLPLVTLAASSFMIFFGIGLTSANASMGAVSLFPKTAGAASAVFGFVHATIAAAVGLLAGQLYDGTLLPTTSVMLACAVAGVFGIPMTRSQDKNAQPSVPS